MIWVHFLLFATCVLFLFDGCGEVGVTSYRPEPVQVFPEATVPDASPTPSPSPTNVPYPSSSPAPSGLPNAITIPATPTCSVSWTNSVFLYSYTSAGGVVPRDLPQARITVTRGAIVIYDGPLSLTYTSGASFQMQVHLPSINATPTEQLNWYICKPRVGQANCVQSISSYDVGSTFLEFYRYAPSKVVASIQSITTQGVSLMTFEGRTSTLFPGACGSQNSPLILDLGRDGIPLSGLYQSGVTFDLDTNGFRENTGWVTNGRDAFLVRDLNHNGVIDSGLELFGNHTKLKNGMPAANGFEALKELDKNKNGFFEPAEDPSVLLWLDENRNGLTDPGELTSLEKFGIARIGLSYVESVQEDLYGNQSRQQSAFWFKTGVKSLIADIWFRVQ